MTFPNITLNDGAEIPSIAFGTGSVWKGQDVVTYIDQALEAGFSHIDTAAIYKNEDSVGTAIRESGLQRSDLYITTKFDGGIIRDALLSSLSKIGIKSVDLYLIHFPGVIADGDLEGAWAQMEAVRDEGLTKSIGVSNFKVADLKRIVKVAKVIPVVNQIRFHPYNFAEYAELLEYSAQYGIVTEAYGSLAPITTFPNGPLTPVLSTIAKRLSTDEKVQATPAQVIFKWVQSKGAVIVTTSGKKERLEEYLAVESLPDLTEEEIKEIEEKGAEGAKLFKAKEWIDEARSRIVSVDMRKRAIVCILAAFMLLFVMYARSNSGAGFDVPSFRNICHGMSTSGHAEELGMD